MTRPFIALAGLSPTKRTFKASSSRRPSLRLRRLRSEPLEDRRMLAAVTVDNNLDLVNGDTSSIANLIANDGGDGIALREAIDAANNTLGGDEIQFSVTGTINIASQLPDDHRRRCHYRPRTRVTHDRRWRRRRQRTGNLRRLPDIQHRRR